MAYLPRETRKARLAEATWQIILDRGIGAVSVRTVAAEAGMAAGSLRHLFPTQAELLEFSAELMVERATARVSATPWDADAVSYALAAIRELLPLTAESRREFEVNIALIAETPAHPQLARIRDHAHSELLDLFARIVAMVRDQGEVSSAARKEGRRLLALVDGLGLHLIQQSATADVAWVIAVVRDELVRLRDSGAVAP